MGADELEFEPSIEATHIGVAVDKGIVTLTGHVSSYMEKLAAERAVRRIKGVRAIAEDIDIRLPFEKKTGDEEIARRVLNILHWDIRVPEKCVQVTVQDGWVTLAGGVDWQFQRQAAEEGIRKLSGVAGVINHIDIKARVQVPDIRARIEQALKRHAEIEAKGIRITFDAGKLTLDGTVHNLQEREAVENAAWSAPGVQTVEDRLIIG